MKIPKSKFIVIGTGIYRKKYIKLIEKIPILYRSSGKFGISITYDDNKGRIEEFETEKERDSIFNFLISLSLRPYEKFERKDLPSGDQD